MPKYLDMHGLETLTGDIENTYLKKNQKGAAGGVASLDSNGKVPASQIPGGAGGTSDYTNLDNKPQINGNTLSGNKTTENLGIHDIPSGGTTGQVLAKSSDSNYDVQWVNQQGGGVQDVSYKGTSLVDQTGTANIPPAQTSVPGLAMVGAGYGLKAADPDGNSAGRISTDAATSSHIRFFTDQYRPITPYYLPEAVFRGLAQVAGDDTQTDSQNPVGTYTDDAKEAIQEMLNVPDATENADEHSALLTDLNSCEILEKLRADDIPGTTQTITFDQQTGDISQITHTANNTAVRTDVFTFGNGTITEVRTLSTGQSLTIVTNTTTLETTVTYADLA